MNRIDQLSCLFIGEIQLFFYKLIHMIKVKIHNINRLNKQTSRQQSAQYRRQNYDSFWGENYEIHCQVSKLEKKLGYDYWGDDASNPRVLVDLRNEFRDKVAKYYGGHKHSRKMTRFDKMQIKEELGLKFKKNPILQSLQNAEKILSRLSLIDSFQTFRRC